MRKYFDHKSKPFLLIILIFLSGCATREDFRQSFMARFVKDGQYTNHVKGFRLIWPESDAWIFRNYPEFDLSFDHIDGRSQILIVGVNKLIRRDFPDGFQAWIMQRLRARNINQMSHERIAVEDGEKFRIVNRCEFIIETGQQLGIHRMTDTVFLRRDNQWVAMICICPVESYEQKKPVFEALFDNISML